MYLKLVKVFWNQQLAYRIHYLMTVINTPIKFFVIVLIWSAVYANNNGQPVGSYTLPQLIFYFILIQYLHILTYTGVDSHLEQRIRSGALLQHLIKPYRYITYALTESLAARLLAITIEIIPITIIFLLFFSEYLVAGQWGTFLISAMLSAGINFFMSFMIGCLAFWFVSIRSFAWSFNFLVALVGGAIVPIDLFPAWGKMLVDILPFKYLFFVPVQTYLGAYVGAELIWVLLMQVLWLVIFVVGSVIMWRIAYRKFEGVGS